MPTPINKTNLLNNFALKTISFALGYLVWAMVSTHHTVETTITIPVSSYSSFGNQKESLVFTGPEQISVRISAPRKQLSMLISKLAVHIDETTLVPGDNSFTITPELLFLPESAKLIHSLPESIIIHAQESKA